MSNLHNELMLGNLIYCTPKGGSIDQRRIIEVDVDVLKNIVNDSDYFIYEPIHLTDDIVSEYGFQKEQASKTMTFERRERDGVYIERFRNGPFYHDYINVVELHQLQNLFFCLTGEKLTRR